MSEMGFSKKGERLVTPFVGQELLYDYIRGELDAERITALEKLLSENRELRGELDKIRDGLQYIQELGQTGVSDVLTESIRTPSTYLHVLLAKTRFTEWPEGVKLALEGFLIAVSALALIIVIPWGKVLSLRTVFDKPSVVLTEVTKTREDLQEGDDQVPGKEPVKVAASETKNEKPETKTVAVEKAPAKPEAAKVAAVAPVAAKAPVPAPTAEKGIAAPAPDSGKKQGFLYRGSMQVSSLDESVPKLVSFIDSVGGKKAGEVDLGWKKGSGSYFHFTIPEAKYKELVQEFGQYGKLKIQKEPHPRVMPDGTIRLIITVDEKPAP